MKKLYILLVGLLLVGAGCAQNTGKIPDTSSNGGGTVTTSPGETQGTTTVKVFLVALEDNGKSGPKIGCGDSVIAVTRTVAPTTNPLLAAMQELLSIKDRMYGESGLYNSLYQSNLRVESAEIVGGKAVVALTGTHMLGGVCDDPRFEAQLIETARQFSTVQTVEITINGKKLQDVISEK